jgi:hypothetical protein
VFPRIIFGGIASVGWEANRFVREVRSEKREVRVRWEANRFVREVRKREATVRIISIFLLRTEQFPESLSAQIEYGRISKKEWHYLLCQ